MCIKSIDWIGSYLLDMCNGDVEVFDISTECVYLLKMKPKVYFFTKNIFDKETLSRIEGIVKSHESYIRNALDFIREDNKINIDSSKMGDAAFLFRYNDFVKNKSSDGIWSIQFNEIISQKYKGFGITVDFYRDKPFKLEDLQIETCEQWYNDETEEWVDL